MQIQHFFDAETFTLTYVLHDPKSLDAVVIDPVLDFDPASGKIDDKSIKGVVDYIENKKLKVKAILETHAHADHLSSSQILKQLYPQAKIAISEKIKIVQETFIPHFNMKDLKADGSQFDLLIKDFETLSFGTLKMKAIPTPGHTPACMSFLFDDALFTGDTLFMPDSGTGRCDFPKGSAVDIYHSIKKNIYSLPDNIRVFVGHDYQPNGREIKCETTIAESKKLNIQIKAETPENEFIDFRVNRDKTLKAPRLLLPSLQVNINAGHLPAIEENGKNYLKIPLNVQTQLAKL